MYAYEEDLIQTVPRETLMMTRSQEARAFSDIKKEEDAFIKRQRAIEAQQESHHKYWREMTFGPEYKNITLEGLAIKLNELEKAQSKMMGSIIWISICLLTTVAGLIVLSIK